MYKLSGVTKNYTNGRSTVAGLDSVNLVVEDGKWLAVQGPTGHGKSTLLQILGGLDRPSEDTRDEIIALLETIWYERGLTMVLVTHDHSIARRAQRIGVMRNGRLGFRQADPGPNPAHVPSPDVQAGPVWVSDRSDLDDTDLSGLEDDDSEPADTITFDYPAPRTRLLARHPHVPLLDPARPAQLPASCAGGPAFSRR